MADFQYTRVLSHGQITDLSGGYRADYPFSIYLRPKEGARKQCKHGYDQQSLHTNH